MKLFTSQEKTVFRFLIGTMLAGLIVGAIRHNYFDNKRDNIVTHERKASFLKDSQLPLDTDAVSVLQEIVADGQEEALREGSIKKKIEIINVNTAKKDELIIFQMLVQLQQNGLFDFKKILECLNQLTI